MNPTTPHRATQPGRVFLSRGRQTRARLLARLLRLKHPFLLGQLLSGPHPTPDSPAHSCLIYGGRICWPERPGTQAGTPRRLCLSPMLVAEAQRGFCPEVMAGG